MKSHRPDYILLGAVTILIVLGLVMLSSASIVKSQEQFNQPYYYLKHQLLYGLLIAAPCALIAYKINYRAWKKLAFLLFFVAVALLLLVLLPGFGLKSGGSTRWISFGQYSFQPSEIAKLALIIYLAAWLDDKTKTINNLKNVFIPFIIILSLTAGPVLLQPNIGTAGVMGLTAIAIFFAAGAKFWQVSSILLIGATALLAYIKIFFHATNRFLIFIHPELDPQGIGYQINQALLAIGSGGLFGLGPGQSIQKYNYLPEPMGDSIFAIIAEELGFIGAAIVIILFIILTIRGFRIAKEAPDNQAKLLAVGIASGCTIQAFINIAAISGLIPLTGVPLPFISYGGTAFIISLIGMGILLNISKYT
ncbi:MAG: putative lipid II flippase FtsW [Candidatus Portnoybacteria bacterium]|nr:putative lipid II flippase FtsW [Candidatus Portnoybacteria bacterium]